MPGGSGAPPAPPILVASADPGIRERCRSALARAGRPVELAADGAAAFARMAAGAPALLILDWELPGVTPRVVAAAARQAFGASLPIVVLAPEERGPRLATELGAAAWVREPIAPEALLAAVRRALGADADGGPSLGEAHCWDEARQS